VSPGRRIRPVWKAKPRPSRSAHPCVSASAETKVSSESPKVRTHFRRVPAPWAGTYWKMFTARAATSRIVTAEAADSASISAFARWVSGIASVGLNAIAFVNAT
jgi:hypothetical protein